MGRGKKGDVEFSKVLNRLVHANLGSSNKVGAPQDGMDRSASCDGLNVSKGVDDSGMAAAEQNHGSLGSVEEHRLIVRDGVRIGACLIQIEISARILIVRLTWHSTGSANLAGDG
jgi:hypothetical protein